MCEETVSVFVKIPADLSSTGKTKWKYTGIDKCLAPIVKALQQFGIDMRGSCCGHHKQVGDIHLQDGRVLIIADYSRYDRHRAEINEILGKQEEEEGL